MAETRIRVVNNASKFEMVYFLEATDASVVRNRIFKFNIDANVADPVQYLDKKFCNKALCPNNGEYKNHGEIKAKDLKSAAAQAVQAHCPEGYEFYQVGVAIHKIGDASASKEGNIEIKYRPKGAAPAAGAPTDNPDNIIVVNIHLKQGDKKDQPMLKTILDAFNVDVRKKAIGHVNTTTLDNFKERYFDFVLTNDPDSPQNWRAYKAATKAALEAKKLALTFANKINEVPPSKGAEKAS